MYGRAMSSLDDEPDGPDGPDGPEAREHGGVHALRAARAHGVTTLFTLSGAHVFPLYDAAVGGAAGFASAGDARRAAETANPRLLDVRHEATAGFAAEGTGRLTRRPGLAVVTAGPGVTNVVSAVTSAHFNGAPLVVIGGRSPDFRAGSGALQELDQPPLLAPITKHSSTVHHADMIGQAAEEAFTIAGAAHRGPVFLDIPMDVLYTPTPSAAPADPDSLRTPTAPDRCPDPDLLDAVAALLAESAHPVLVLSTDVWADGAEHAARRFAEELGLPTFTTGLGRGILPRGHDLLVTRARSTAFAEADLVIVAGAPLDFRLAYGRFGSRDRATTVVHLVDSASQSAAHASNHTTTVAGDLSAIFDGILLSWATLVRRPSFAQWATRLRGLDLAARADDASLLHSESDPIHPARIYGELLPRLTDDTVVIGDGGDFVSFAGRFIEPAAPGRWLDPGPYGCLGSGLGYAIAARLAHPSSPVVLLLGDGAAGFSLMDVDSLVRHRLPVVMVMGNNSGWGLERHPMRFLHGYDVITDLNPAVRYDEVVVALGGGGERVTAADQIGSALDRALASGIPYLVDIATDPEATYPRTTTGL